MAKQRLFLCYRRDDSSHQVGRINDHLERHFGRGNVFRDVDAMPPGMDFRRKLEDAVAGCDVVLVVIGDKWLTLQDQQGRRRLDTPDDFVRTEVELALNRGIPVLPVLIGDTPMPAPESLPAGIQALAFRHAVQVRTDPDFRRDVERLVSGVRLAADSSPRMNERIRAGRRWAIRLAVVFAALAATAVATAAFLAFREPNRGIAPQQALFEPMAVALPVIPAGFHLVMVVTDKEERPQEKTYEFMTRAGC
jgi:hypothetical protein